MRGAPASAAACAPELKSQPPAAAWGAALCSGQGAGLLAAGRLAFASRLAAVLAWPRAAR
eukprot:scaffold65146_cov69-Phaeocystis_antarctica.AAC.1